MGIDNYLNTLGLLLPFLQPIYFLILNNNISAALVLQKSTIPKCHRPDTPSYGRLRRHDTADCNTRRVTTIQKLA